jgi:hypothetical protein
LNPDPDPQHWGKDILTSKKGFTSGGIGVREEGGRSRRLLKYSLGSNRDRDMAPSFELLFLNQGLGYQSDRGSYYTFFVFLI